MIIKCNLCFPFYLSAFVIISQLANTPKPELLKWIRRLPRTQAGKERLRQNICGLLGRCIKSLLTQLVNKDKGETFPMRKDWEYGNSTYK